jgi:hypothetical protein
MESQDRQQRGEPHLDGQRALREQGEQQHDDLEPSKLDGQEELELEQKQVERKKREQQQGQSLTEQLQQGEHQEQEEEKQQQVGEEREKGEDEDRQQEEQADDKKRQQDQPLDVANQKTSKSAPPRTRPTRQAAQQNKYTESQEEPQLNDTLPSSYGTDGGDPNARVSLDKMKIQSLRKYAKVYDLNMVHPQSSREDLLAAVKRHWAGAHVSEEGVVQNLMRMRTRGGSY